MRFEEVLPLLKDGKKIRRVDKDWQNIFGYVFYNKKQIDLLYSKIEGKKQRYLFNGTDLSVDDWEIVEEKKKVKLRDLTEEQYKKWIEDNCDTFGDYCNGCPFQKVRCDNYEKKNDWWLGNKDLYSDKFLDQEVEVEE